LLVGILIRLVTTDREANLVTGPGKAVMQIARANKVT